MSNDDSLDGKLTDRLISGDQTVFGDMLMEYGPQVAGLLRKTFSWLRTEDIDDVLAEAIVTLWKRRDKYDKRRGSLRAFFYTIARSRAVDLTRKSWQKAKQRELSLTTSGGYEPEAREALDPDQSDEANADIGQDLANLSRVLDQLSEVDRVIVLASTQEGNWAKDLQQQLGISAGTIRVKRHRLVAKIRKELGGLVAEVKSTNCL